MLTCASVISTLFFCVGFFPLAVVKNIESEIPIHESKINRSILMIIDALRLDFLASDTFSYVHKLIENKQGCLLQYKASLPTVTKPRIKVSQELLSLVDKSIKFLSFSLSSFQGIDIWNGINYCFLKFIKFFFHLIFSNNIYYH